MTSSSARKTALRLARVIPAIGLMITEPLPEVLRDSRSQMILLQMLCQRQAITVSELAQAMGVAVPTASTMVRKMVAKGLLERTRSQEDWRSVLVTLSPAGIELHHAMIERRAQALEGLLGGRSEADLATLRAAAEILGTMAENGV